MQKNVAGQKWIVYAWDITTHAPVTGDAANITSNLRLDGGGPNAIDDTNPTELEDGFYIFDITRVESNADLVLISPASSTGNVQVDGVPKSVWTNQNIALADRNAALTESRYGFHTWQGNFYYVDPVNGGTHAGGNRGGRDDPYDSVQDCHDNAVVDNNHDVIILVSGAVAGVTTLTEAVTLTKRYLFIRGPGRDFIWTRSGNGDTITITADGIELSGFQLNTAGAGSGDGISATDVDFMEVHDVWINATQGDGIHILRGDNCRIRNNTFTDTGQSGAGQGIHIVGTAGTSNNNIIEGNIFRDPAGDAILVEQGTTNNTTIKNNVIEGASGWGINIGASSIDAVVAGNCLGNNASGNINDNGTTTTQTNNEQWAKHSIATEARLAELDAANIPTDIANVPGLAWDVLLTGASHNIATSAGRRLRQLSSVVVTDDTAEVSNSPGINQIQLSSAESVIDGTFDPGIVGLVAGTGAGQCRMILEYEGATRLATLNRDWKIAPDATTEYIILCSEGGLHVNEGLAQGGSNTSITLNSLASSTDNVYNGQRVFLVSGPGQDQVGRVTAYNGTTKVATIDTTLNGWAVNPDNTTGYIMVPIFDVVTERVPSVLISGRMSSDIQAIRSSTEAATNLEKSASTIVTGAAIAGTLSTTTMTTNLTEATDDHFNGRIIIWTSGKLYQQATDITAYDGATKKLTFSTVTEAPLATDEFVIV